MIDMHSHILPGLDDGAKDLDEAIEMARAAVQDGITTIVATPHHANGHYYNEADVVQEAVDKLEKVLNEEQIPLQLYHGQEVRVNNELIDELVNKKCIPLADSKYMLLEFPSSYIPTKLDELFHELQILGITPIIAHPERNQEIVRDPNKLYSLINEGALSQITAQSIIGAFGKKIQRISIELCKRNLVHFIASDAHNLSSRAFGLKDAYRMIDRKIGLQYSENYRNNASQLIHNLEIHKSMPLAKGKRWYKFATESRKMNNQFMR